MSGLARLLHSSVGGKLVMAVTGLGMVGFVVMHMIGNWLMFVGPDAMNEYAVSIKKLGPLLWLTRLGLLAFVSYHVLLALRLTGRNKAARPTEYAQRAWKATSFASRYMAVGGVVLLAFILFHLAHYTFGWIQPATFAHTQGNVFNGRPDVYGMVIAGFQNPIISLGYVAAMVVLSSHIAHGASSALQTLGLNHPKYNGLLRGVGPSLAVLLALGFSSVPLAVLFGIVKGG